ncbi:MAG: nuclear transport factor 2 family protein [Ignavibacteriales bacterium]|nr:nuclear transport factor 2 family protein [Ignavibacteriales bacterium]
MRTMLSYHLRLLVFFFLSLIIVNNVKSESIPQTTNKKQQADTNSEIRRCLNRMNEVLATKDLQTVMTVYDNSDDIMVVGSDSGEVFIGRERVQEFMKVIVSMPFVFSFDMDQVIINHSENIAWVFVESKMVHTGSNGKVSKVPYRITAVMIKRGNEWKWKVFSGSIPRGE